MKFVKLIRSIYVILFLLFPVIAKGDITWTSEKQLTTNAGNSESPSIAVYGSKVYVVWSDNTSGDYDIFFTKSTNGGNTWSAKKKLSSTSGSSEKPAIAVDGSNIYLVWSDNTTDNYELFFTRSANGGMTWETMRITDMVGFMKYPSIAVDDSGIYVVWSDNAQGNDEIFFKSQQAADDTWGTMRLTDNIGDSKSPSIAVSGLNAHVVWSDNTHGNYEIFYKDTKTLYFKVPYKSITIDGNYDDWKTQDRVYLDDDGPECGNSPGQDIKAVYVAQDDNYIYFRFVLNGPLDATFGYKLGEYSFGGGIHLYVGEDITGGYIFYTTPIPGFTSPRLPSNFIAVTNNEFEGKFEKCTSEGWLRENKTGAWCDQGRSTVCRDLVELPKMLFDFSSSVIAFSAPPPNISGV